MEKFRCNQNHDLTKHQIVSCSISEIRVNICLPCLMKYLPKEFPITLAYENNETL